MPQDHEMAQQNEGGVLSLIHDFSPLILCFMTVCAAALEIRNGWRYQPENRKCGVDFPRSGIDGISGIEHGPEQSFSKNYQTIGGYV